MRLSDLVGKYLGTEKADVREGEGCSCPVKGEEASDGTAERDTCRHSIHLTDDISRWPEEWRETYEERAGLMEFDGGLPRQQAERQAELLVREANRAQQRHSFSSKIADDMGKTQR